MFTEKGNPVVLPNIDGGEKVEISNFYQLNRLDSNTLKARFARGLFAKPKRNSEGDFMIKSLKAKKYSKCMIEQWDNLKYDEKNDKLLIYPLPYYYWDEQGELAFQYFVPFVPDFGQFSRTSYLMDNESGLVSAVKTIGGLSTFSVVTMNICLPKKTDDVGVFLAAVMMMLLQLHGGYTISDNGSVMKDGVSVGLYGHLLKNQKLCGASVAITENSRSNIKIIEILKSCDSKGESVIAVTDFSTRFDSKGTSDESWPACEQWLRRLGFVE